jgi:hypothetical protein
MAPEENQEAVRRLRRINPEKHKASQSKPKQAKSTQSKPNQPKAR